MVKTQKEGGAGGRGKDKAVKKHPSWPQRIGTLSPLDWEKEN